MVQTIPYSKIRHGWSWYVFDIYQVSYTFYNLVKKTYELVYETLRKRTEKLLNKKNIIETIDFSDLTKELLIPAQDNIIPLDLSSGSCHLRFVTLFLSFTVLVALNNQ